ncbi:MAG TPA: 1,2-phenylacetyl-CoA epoxidase subunit PaaC [Salinisphaeraceae bacterium]|nr:1,2-phenylacetyl-CoA epoxidase subunit PaaC [Salinisphaeraceae bacterium]
MCPPTPPVDNGAPNALATAEQVHDPHVVDAQLKPAFFDWLCRTGDTTLILGHRLSEWCGHGPALEEDIALTNIALDLIGHTQMWLGLAGKVEGEGRTADDLAYRRDAMKFRNILLVELPNQDMAITTMRQFLFDAFHYELLQRLLDSASPRVGEIAAKALKEVSYHVERAADLVIRLGDGSTESHRRMQDALDQLWSYTGDMFVSDEVDDTMAAADIAPRPDSLREAWLSRVREVLDEATLTMPEDGYVHTGGKTGRHTEHLGYILAEMQFLQRAYPDASW